jgi:hypothetical protein
MGHAEKVARTDKNVIYLHKSKQGAPKDGYLEDPECRRP